ncbi:UDP-N-acetylmuramyl tripeptide synthase [Pseudomonas fulva]
METREPSNQELEALKIVLAEALPGCDQADLVEVAIEHAKAIRSAFSELCAQAPSAV